MRQSTPSAPPELRGLIEADLASAPPAESAAIPSTASDGSWLHRTVNWVRQPRRVNGYAVAACVLLVVGVIALSIQLSTIDDVGQLPGHGSPMAVAGEVAETAARSHHKAVADPELRQAMLPFQTMGEAAFELGRRLNISEMVVFDLSEVGFEFLGAGSIEGPDQQPMARLMYKGPVARSSSGNVSRGDRVYLTLIMFHNPASIGLPPTYDSSGPIGGPLWGHFEIDGGEECSDVVFYAADDAFLYCLVTGEQAGAMAASQLITRSRVERR